jgi:hypothetical protein
LLRKIDFLLSERDDMEVKIYKRAASVVFDLALGRRTPRVRFSDAWIVLVHLWGVVHDRPTCWSCEERNWRSDVPRPAELPDPGTMSRRLRTVGVRHLLELVEARFVSLFPRGLCYWIDSKALPVGGASKDRDAKVGRGAGGVMAKGYRLHMLYNAAGVAVKWMLSPMSGADAVVGRRVIEAAAADAAERNVPLAGYLGGDNLYDAARLYEQSAGAGMQLVAPPRKNAKGLGHRRQNPGRLRGLELARERPIGKDVLKSRGGIERVFGTMGNCGFGLGPLPNWVRRPRRVSMWVAAKLLFEAIRRALKQGLIA